MAKTRVLRHTSTKRATTLLAILSTLLIAWPMAAVAQSAGMTVSKATAAPTEAGTADTFTVVLDAQPSTSVTLSVTNSAPTQLTVSPLYLTFTNTNWDTAQTVTLTATNDTVADETNSATVTLAVLDATSDDAFDSVPDTVVNVAVVDDDFCGLKVIESNGSTGVTEAATLDTFTVALGAQPTTDVVVSVVSGDTTEATVSTAQLTFTNANWSTTQTVTVTGVNDETGDGNQTSAVTLAIVDASSDNCFDPAADTIVSVRTGQGAEPPRGWYRGLRRDSEPAVLCVQLGSGGLYARLPNSGWPVGVDACQLFLGASSANSTSQWASLVISALGDPGVGGF